MSILYKIPLDIIKSWFSRKLILSRKLLVAHLFMGEIWTLNNNNFSAFIYTKY